MEDVSRELGLLFRSLKGMHASVLAEAGLRIELPAASVLLTLEERGPVRLSTVAETLQVDLSSVSRQVAALERDGRVSRRRDPDDSRAVLLELTPDGRDVLARLRAARAAHLQRLLPAWDEADLAEFAASLRRFRTDLTTRAPDPTTPVLAGQEST